MCTPASSDSGYVLAYWYFTFTDQDTINIDNLLSSIIRQLCAGTQRLPGNVRELWMKHHKAGSRPSRASLIETLNTIVYSLDSIDKQVFVVLDALDEYPLAVGQDHPAWHQTSGREEVLHWLEQAHTSHSNVHFLVLSRDENDIRSKLGEASRIDVAEWIEDDLNRFIKKSIARILEEKPWKMKYKSQLLARFEEKNESRFRWASLVLQKLSGCMDYETMQEALTHLPDSLEDIYDDVLVNKIPRGYEEKARLLLMWLCYSLKPLTLRELAYIASVPEPQDILKICTSSFVSRQPDVSPSRASGVKRGIECGIVKIDHFSVKEYLASEHLLSSETTAYFYTTPLMVHLKIADMLVSCLIRTNQLNLSYLAAPGDVAALARLAEHFDKYPGFVENCPLLEYSVMWFRHIHEADAIEDGMSKTDESSWEAQSTASQPTPETLRARSHRLFCDGFSQSMQNWLYLLHRVSSVNLHFNPTTPLVVTSMLGLADNVRRLLISGADVEEEAGVYHKIVMKPIHFAAMMGHSKIVSLLLGEHADLRQSELDVIVRRNLSGGAAVLSTILEARSDLVIMDSTVMESANNTDSSEMLDYILDHGDILTPTLIEAIAKECRHLDEHKDLVGKIMTRGEEVGCNSDCMLKAFVGRSSCGKNIRIVLDRYKPAASMSKDVIMWLTENLDGHYGELKLPFVLDYYRDAGVEIEISPQIMVKVAGYNYSAVTWFKAMLSCTKRLVITMDVLASILDNPDRENILEHLLNDHEPCRAKSWDHIRETDRHFYTYRRFSECKIAVSDEMREAAARWEPHAIEHLREHALPKVIFAKTFEEAEACESHDALIHRGG